MRIYLCDLAHTGQGLNSELVPYAIGCLKARLVAGGVEDVHLFKEPERFIAAFREQRPDVVGFSNYLWNANLSSTLAREVKAECPGTLTVFGGPNFPLGDEDRQRWIEARPWVDVYIHGEAERRLLGVVLAHASRGCRVPTKTEIWPSLEEPFEAWATSSPYLSGALDEFLTDPRLNPMMEYARGCPFSCTFCVDGAGECKKVRHRSLETVTAELEYIAARTCSSTLFLADLNFGMYREDLDFARAIGQVQQASGFPQYIVASTGKQHKERVVEAAELTNYALRVAGSVQSMDPVVLENIGRQNVSVEALAAMTLDLKGSSANTYAEMILGLPGDTREKHTTGVCQLMDLGFDQIRMHQLTLLDGSTMATAAQREQFKLQTAQRILQRSFGTYAWAARALPVVETEEVVVSGDGMTFEDYLWCRSFALTVALAYNEQAFIELAGLMGSAGLRYADFLLYLHEQIDRAAPPSIRDIYGAFKQAALEELWFDRFDLDAQMVGEPRFMERLSRGEIGNNLLFNAQGRVMYSHYADLCGFVFSLAEVFVRRTAADPLPEWLHSDYLDQLCDYCQQKKGHLRHLRAVGNGSYDWDFLAQDGAHGWSGMAPERSRPVRLRFAFDDQQRAFWSEQLVRFGTTDQGLGKVIARAPIKHTYRKVSYAD